MPTPREQAVAAVKAKQTKLMDAIRSVVGDEIALQDAAAYGVVLLIAGRRMLAALPQQQREELEAVSLKHLDSGTPP